ncbi:MAG: ABC transporter substrate-binding protein [Pseudomonadota bacterium]
MTRRIVPSLLTALMIGVSASTATAEERVDISLFSWPGYGFWFIAEEKDLAPELDLNITMIEDPYESFGMMSAGQLDVTSSTVEYGPIAAEEDVPVRLVSYTNPSYGVDKIILRPGYETAEDLKGESVAVLEGGLTQIFMAIWLEDNGVAFDEVEYRNLIMDDAVSAMIGGNVAAGEFWEPFGSQLLEIMDGAKVAATSSEDYWIETALLGDGMYMGEHFIEERPDVAARTMDAYFEAVAFWKENPEEGNRIIAEGLGFDVEDVEQVIGATGETKKGGIHIFSRDQAARFMGLMEGEPPLGLSNGQIHDHWKLTSTWWEKFGLISEVRDTDAGTEFSVMETMLESQ